MNWQFRFFRSIAYLPDLAKLMGAQAVEWALYNGLAVSITVYLLRLNLT
jgi:hypothetical protein